MLFDNLTLSQIVAENVKRKKKASNQDLSITIFSNITVLAIDDLLMIAIVLEAHRLLDLFQFGGFQPRQQVDIGQVFYFFFGHDGFPRPLPLQAPVNFIPFNSQRREEGVSSVIITAPWH